MNSLNELFLGIKRWAGYRNADCIESIQSKGLILCHALNDIGENPENQKQRSDWSISFL
jgi:hypothetical protein